MLHLHLPESYFSSQKLDIMYFDVCWIFRFSQFLVGICWMYNQLVTRWEKWITFHTIFLNKGKNMKRLVAYQFCLNFLYQGEDVKHFVGLGSAQFAWAKGRILCNLCHIITFHTIFFSRGKKHEAFCGCCQTNQNALLELVSHFMWAAKQDWAVTGCLFGSLVPGKKMQIHFHLAHSLNISRFGWTDGWIPCENAKRILCPDTKIPHCKSHWACWTYISINFPECQDVTLSCCTWCDCVMLCTLWPYHVVHTPGEGDNLGISLLLLTIFFIEILLLINWLTWWLYFIKDSFWCSIHFRINLMFHFQIFATQKNIGWELSCLSQALQFPCCHVLCYYYTCFEYRCRSLWKTFTSSQVVLCKQQILLEYETNVHVV